MALSFRFGTVGSPLMTPPSPGGTVGGIRYAAQLGLDALELAWVQGVRVQKSTCAAIRAEAERTGIALSVHAPYYINLNAEDDKWPRLRQYLMDAAHFGYLAGATDIVFHPGSYFGRTPDEVMQVVFPRLEACVRELRCAGNPVRLRPETMGKSAVIGSLQDTLTLSQIEGVLPCLDFAHLHARYGDGRLNSYDEWMELLEAYQKALGTKALQDLHIHLSGIEYGPKGEKNHLPIEESDLNLVALFQALRDVGAKGRILSESPILEQDALKFRALWIEISGESIE
ncbi:MAG: TIM barrel protein [Anaerolineales bacterium]|nr:TIM barrel protein [Anaerolineales bacterium]MCX7608314.1 TIM barrel protein [Anaerolineales bacterium]MDW8227343.1 TIM barrel protein [Anaerolineales bacterium]